MRDIYHVQVKSLFTSKYEGHDFYIESNKDIDWLIDYIRECLRMILNRPSSEFVFVEVFNNHNIPSYRLDIDDRMHYIVSFHKVKLATI